MVIPSVLGVTAVLVRERVTLPQSFRHLPGHCCHHCASATIIAWKLGQEGRKTMKKQTSPLSDPQRNSFCCSSVQKERLSLRLLSVHIWYVFLGLGAPLSTGQMIPKGKNGKLTLFGRTSNASLLSQFTHSLLQFRVFRTPCILSMIYGCISVMQQKRQDGVC